MSDAASESRTNATEYTVSELSGALKRTVEDGFGNVRVRGEVSGYRGPHSSGHCLFRAEGRPRPDRRRGLERHLCAGCASSPEEGTGGRSRTGKHHHLSRARPNTRSSSSNLEPAGAGALMALLEERKRRLAGRRACSMPARKTPAAVPAARHRRRHLADRVPSSATSSTASTTAFPLHVHGLAGARAGRDIRRGSGRRHSTASTRWPGAAHIAAPRSA